MLYGVADKQLERIPIKAEISRGYPISMESLIGILHLRFFKAPKIAPKLSTMVGENFKYRSSEIAKIAPKLSTIVGEIFKQYSQIAKIAPNCPPWLEKF